MLPLEDLYHDVIAKAQRGLRLDNTALARQAGIELSRLERLKAGELDEEALDKVAPVLHLHAPSLQIMARQQWQPRPIELPGLAQFNTVYDDMTVNAYLVWDSISREAAAFDSGASATPILEFIRAKDLTLKAVYLTHTHVDHVADLDTLRAHHEPLFTGTREPWPGAQPFDSGATFSVGGLTIETRLTWGHSPGGITYVISGLAQPVAVVGDALFASSMGGGGISYADALATNRKEIFSLPDHTIVCPGHGPFTTVGEEKVHNPFYPEFKS